MCFYTLRWDYIPGTTLQMLNIHQIELNPDQCPILLSYKFWNKWEFRESSMRLCMGVLGSGENGVKKLGSREHGVKKTREQGAKESI